MIAKARIVTDSITKETERYGNFILLNQGKCMQCGIRQIVQITVYMYFIATDKKTKPKQIKHKSFHGCYRPVVKS